MVNRKRDDRISRSVSVLVSMLVRYPEVGTVKYEPRQQTIRMGLVITGEMTDADWNRTEQDLFDTLDVYHLLEQRQPSVLDVAMESYGELTSIAITRDVATFSPEEIYTIVEFFKERFAGRLVTELVDWPANEDEMIAQDELIEELVADLEENRSSRNLIAIREDGRVMVFRK
ncbi:MAG TPA: hypothetical protein VK464_22575 [Symbiobacteriaceae bacterium]|nr:hypothetical protein [Symbiobacteriaceae bacterium]